MKLKDKVVFITGASSGLGASTAKVLALKGAKTALLARRQDRLETLSRQISETGAETLVLPTNVTDRVQVEVAVERCVKRFGRIDVVINCAGIGAYGSVASLTDDDLSEIIEVNAYGVLHTVQTSLPYLKVSQGMIVNITSILGKRTLPYLSALSASKGVVDALTESMRLELKQDKIKVLSYGPPQMKTDFGGQNKQGKRRLADPDDVAIRLVKAIEKEKREVIEGKFFSTMNFFAPKLVDKLFYKVMVEKKDQSS